MLTLDTILWHAARADPQRAALAYAGRTRTYGELADRARRLAAALAARGVRRGDRVAFWSPNHPAFLEFIFGVPALGAIAVPMDHWWTTEEGLAALERCRPAALIAGAVQARLADAVRPRLEELGVASCVALEDPPGPLWASYEQLLASASPLRSAPAAPLDDPALILFTSGSTGRARGAVHTHRDLAHTAAVMALELGIREGERTLHVLPLFSSCLEQLIPLTLVRATHVVLPEFDADRVWEAVERHGITHFDAVPTILKRLLDAAPATLPQTLRLVSYASEPMPAPLISAWLDRAPEVGFVQFYGMIEHLGLTVQKPWEQRSKIGTVGRPMLGAEIQLRAADGSPAAPGEAGEIVARSPTLMAGYWEDPAGTRAVLQDGWMRTGDLGRFDSDGYLVLDGRLKEIIKSGGMTVAPREVEEVLLRHPAVIGAAVIGVPNEGWGEAVHAFVTLRPGARVTERELRSFCRGALASYKCPKAVEIIPELPRTGIGKVARGELRRIVVERSAPRSPAK